MTSGGSLLDRIVGDMQVIGSGSRDKPNFPVGRGRLEGGPSMDSCVSVPSPKRIMIQGKFLLSLIFGIRRS